METRQTLGNKPQTNLETRKLKLGSIFDQQDK